MTPVRRCSRVSAFTLVEVIAALTILLLVFMSSIAALNIGFKMLEEARASTLASQILQSQVENIRLRSWDEVVAMAADPAYREFPVEISSTLTNFPTFECTCDFHPVAGLETKLTRVTVTVGWSATDGRSRSRRYVTFVAKDGISDFYYRAP